MTFVLDLMVQAAEVEDRDKVACHMGRVYNKGTDKDTEEIHKPGAAGAVEAEAQMRGGRRSRRGA